MLYDIPVISQTAGDFVSILWSELAVGICLLPTSGCQDSNVNDSNINDTVLSDPRVKLEALTDNRSCHLIVTSTRVLRLPVIYNSD